LKKKIMELEVLGRLERCHISLKITLKRNNDLKH
jgi:hypothetical protein